MTEMIQFAVPLPPVGLRRNSLMRHLPGRARLTREYQGRVWCEAHMWHAPHWTVMTEVADKGIPWERAKVHYAWHSTHQTDEDNIIASMKAALDVLHMKGARPLGIILDDSGAEVTATWVKAAHKADEEVIITVEKIA